MSDLLILYIVTWRAPSGRVRRTRLLATSPLWALRAFRKMAAKDVIAYLVTDAAANGISLVDVPPTEPASLPDLRIDALDIGGPWLLTAQTQDGEIWMDEHFPDDATPLGQRRRGQAPRYSEHRLERQGRWPCRRTGCCITTIVLATKEKRQSGPSGPDCLATLNSDILWFQT